MLELVTTGRTRRGTVIVVTSIFVVTLAVNLQVPLYESYAARAGYGQGGLSITFATYVVGLISMLLLFGGAAERFGNKATLLVGLAFALAGHAAILLQPTMQGLVKMRVLQGVSVALTLGAGTASLVQLGSTPKRAARSSGGAVTLGLGGGGLLTNAGLALRQSLVPASYWAVALATLACLCAALTLQPDRASHRAALLRIPLVSRSTLPFCAALFFAWSLTGIILATIPTRLALIGQGQWSGLVVFVAIALGGAVQLVAGVRQPRLFLKLGNALAVASILGLIVGVHRRSAAWLLLSSAVSGLSSFGFTYVAGLTGVLLSHDRERARAVSGYYLLGYLGFGLPCTLVGYAAERWGLEHALLGYASLVLTSLVLWRLVRTDRARASARI